MIVSAGFSRTKYWFWAASVAAAVSFAYANPARAPHTAAAPYSAYSATLFAAPAHTAVFDDSYRAETRPAARYAGVQYAGAITPVSTETRGSPHPPPNTQTIHTGSIRD